MDRGSLLDSHTSLGFLNKLEYVIRLQFTLAVATVFGGNLSSWCAKRLSTGSCTRSPSGNDPWEHIGKTNVGVDDDSGFGVFVCEKSYIFDTVVHGTVVTWLVGDESLECFLYRETRVNGTEISGFFKPGIPHTMSTTCPPIWALLEVQRALAENVKVSSEDELRLTAIKSNSIGGPPWGQQIGHVASFLWENNRRR